MWRAFVSFPTSLDKFPRCDTQGLASPCDKHKQVKSQGCGLETGGVAPVSLLGLLTSSLSGSAQGALVPGVLAQTIKPKCLGGGPQADTAGLAAWPTLSSIWGGRADQGWLSPRSLQEWAWESGCSQLSSSSPVVVGGQ